jgi:protocatechuate 3,4-dioxygenase beta subunit
MRRRVFVSTVSKTVTGAATAVALGGLATACNGSPTQPTESAQGREPIVGLPCEGCEAVFQGLPATLTSNSIVAGPNESGRQLRIEGTVFDTRGRAANGIIVYAYHTNAQGLYPTDERFRGQAAFRHGRLRGWAVTDARGEYRFDTIRPVGYPDTDLPEHVHMHVIEVGRCTYYIDDLMFEDDQRLTPNMRRQLTLGRGGNGVVSPTSNGGGFFGRRNIMLGERIPGYPA